MSDDSTRMITRPGEPPPNDNDGVTVVLSGNSATPASPTAAAETEAGSASSEVLSVGTDVAEFRITELVGQGGFGIVYKAWDQTLERVVALKEYLPSALAVRRQDGSVTARSERHQETFDAGMRSFINEARLLAQFDHPSLLKVYRFWQDKGTTYMVMPFYRGDTLKQALAAMPEPPSETWLLGVLDSVTQALAVMHGAHCYHRDIAPDNILLLEDSGLPVVLDFGAARRVISDMTQAITVILKPGYAPVEQYAETPDMKQGPWTDVYALGAVLHFAVMGKTPVPSVGRMMKDGYQPLAGRTPPLAGYSERFLQAIDQALRVHPDDRPQSMLEMRQLFGLESGDAPTRILTPPPSRPAQSAPSATPAAPAASRSGKGLLLAGVAAAAVLAAVAGVWWSQSGPVEQVATTSVAPATPAEPPAPAKRPFTPAVALNEMLAQANPDIPVRVTVPKSVVKIGVDKFAFTVESARAGHLYVYLASADGNFNILFPNALDKHNQIEANKPLALPRPAWALVAGGPVGTDHLLAVVSAEPRDHSSAGVQRDDLFSQFPAAVAQAIDAAHQTGPSPFLGTPVCDANKPCDDRYGAAQFSIQQQ
ncbi:MAG: serine/threonine-protein kinase [Hydrogenophaga sp.]|nr:serine/threonine-protein kinase [Hydrogenophaga sp.]